MKGTGMSIRNGLMVLAVAGLILVGCAKEESSDGGDPAPAETPSTVHLPRPSLRVS